jgi:hypothetical protein
MATKRILQADGTSLTAHCWQGGRIRTEAEFSNEPAGIEALAGYLKKHRSSLFYLLADTAEEGFQLEDLPYVQGGDRNALLKRRLGQYSTTHRSHFPCRSGGRRTGVATKKSCSPH